MADEKWQKVREIFDSALRHKPDERRRFVNEVCGDDKTLLAEVESLLSSHDSAESFMETPAVAEVAHMIEIEIKKLEAGKRFGYYEIINQIGVGGMGEVYLARDKKLDRKVAIKILNEEFSEDQSHLQRFVSEAKAASALNHPNILTIYEFGEAEDARFIVSEYIEGKTLREIIRESTLTLPQILDISIQITGALSAAHKAHLVHRDIKPENIMIRPDGYVKVLDFGLAKLVEQKNKSLLSLEEPTVRQNLTAKGVIVGTVNYMSPEQAKGEWVDGRTDIFSLGVLIYEMLAGKPPFEGGNAIETIGSILNKEPVPLSRQTPEVPHEIERIINKALRKDREMRYQTARDLLIDLKDVRQDLEFQNKLERTASPDRKEAKTQVFNPTTSDITPHPTSSAEYIINSIKHHKRLAVLGLVSLLIASIALSFFVFNRSPVLTEKDTILLADFVNTTGDATFDGSTLKQALAVQLRQTPFLNLFPEESVRETLRYMGRPKDEHITPQIGREICRRRGLKALLVGTIASLGRHYAITLEAINGQTGETIASQQIQAESKEQVLKALGQAALELRKQLGESLSTLQKYDAPIEQATTSSLEALNIYSKGLELQYRGDAKGALPLLNRAVELDPNFAEAYLWLSWTYVNLGDNGKAGDFAAKAYSLRDRVTELEKLHIDEIYHLFTTGDFKKQKEADELIKRLYPNDSLAPASLGYSYLRIGQHEQALTEFREAIRSNPNESHYYGNVSDILIRLNRFDEARETIKQAQTRNLDHPGYRNALYMIGLAQGDDTEMQEQLEAIRKIDGEALALTKEGRTAIFFGHWRKAQDLYHRAAALSGTPPPSGTNATLPVAATIAGALFGFCQPATNNVRQALAISRLNSPVQILYVPVLANGSLCGDAGEAQKLADEQLRRYPNATLLHVYSEPIIRAATELQRDRADQAIEFLNAAILYEGGNAAFWPDYLRGQAYLRLRRGDEAAAEFQKILDHRGWDPASPMYPLAHLGRARALSLAGDLTGSRKSYQDFFALWKDADSDLPVLIDARKQYEHLK
jgi:serine/threonine protein kinase/tetratricopeptide (TPR) repeat protein